MLRPLFRRLIALFPAGLALPILSGPLRGARWIVRSSNASCWAGTYERATQRFFVGELAPGDCFVDGGANVGFFTLLGSRLVGAGGRVVAYEPLAANSRSLERHLLLNRATNVRLSRCALADFRGRATFGSPGPPSCAQLGAGDQEVDVVTLDENLEGEEVAAVRLLKIDVEGAEAKVIAGARALLSRRPRPSLYIATHGWKAHAATLEHLADLGFDRLEVEMDEHSGNGSIRFRARD